MTDGSKHVEVVVSHAALDDLDYVSPLECSYFHRFKEHQLHFEAIARRKYNKGYVEVDGTVCIKAADLPFVSTD